MPNPFYHRADENLGVAVGQTLGRALFGDPQLRQQQELHKARLRQAGAGAAFDEARTAGQTQKNAALAGDPAAGLVNLFASMIPAHESVTRIEVSGSDPVGAPARVTDLTPQASPELVAMQTALPRLAAIGAADGQDVTNLARLMAAFAGGDEIARRGLVGAGSSPSESFALTPERADAISARDAAEDYKERIDVENIASGDRRYNTDKDYQASVYNTDVDASTARRGQDVSAQTQRRGQDISSEDRRLLAATRAASRRSSTAAQKPPKAPTTAQMKRIETELKDALRFTGDKPISVQALRTLHSSAIREFQRSGNAVEAANKVAQRYAQAFERRQARSGNDIAALRAEAKRVIQAGGDAAGVRAHFKRMTGQNL